MHAKDTQIYDRNLPMTGVLDTKNYTDERNRAWIFRTCGYGHDAEWWKEFISTLRMFGYDYVLSIEHEDSLMSPEEGLRRRPFPERDRDQGAARRRLVGVGFFDGAQNLHYAPPASDWVYSVAVGCVLWSGPFLWHSQLRSRCPLCSLKSCARGDRDTNGAPLTAARIVLRTATSSRTGFLRPRPSTFEFKANTPGAYWLTVEREGYYQLKDRAHPIEGGLE